MNDFLDFNDNDPDWGLLLEPVNFYEYIQQRLSEMSGIPERHQGSKEEDISDLYSTTNIFDVDAKR